MMEVLDAHEVLDIEDETEFALYEAHKQQTP